MIGSFTNTSGVSPATGAFAVNASGSPDTNINISTGVAYVQATPTSQNSQTLRVRCSVTGTLAIASNVSGSTKYDWIYISVSATNAANPAVGADNVATIVASRSTSASTDDGTPPTYGYPIAVVTVANAFSTITNANIRDIRIAAAVNTSSSSAASGWTDLALQPNTVTYNGNHSYSLVYNSTNLTSTLSVGMKNKLTRLVAAQTQCTDLESSSSQYYSKSTPSGMTFTDDFVASAWVKLESYGAEQTIASRYNGTSGWDFRIDSSGRVVLSGFNAGAANFSYVISYQSIPLNRWVHVTAQLDMSTFTATTTTSYVMLDGVDIPAFVVRGGTNPTALVQAGNLEIGGRNAGLQPFDGKLAQVAIYSAKVTQANVRATISQTLSGSETSLVSAYSFNNSVSDLSANANNLTANNAAVATNADGPFGRQSGGTVSSTLEYGVVDEVTFSTNTTVVVRVPTGNAIPTSGGVSAVSYSQQNSPLGWPGITDIIGEAILLNNFTQASATVAQVDGFRCVVYVPLGKSLRVTADIGQGNNASADFSELSIWDGTVGSGTKLNHDLVGGSTNFFSFHPSRNYTPTSTSVTINVGKRNGSGTTTFACSATVPGLLEVSLID